MAYFTAVTVLFLLFWTTFLSLSTSHVLDLTSHYHQNQPQKFSDRQQNTHEASIPCSCAQGPRVRKEYRSLKEEEFTAFVNAFKALKNTNDGNSIFEQCSAAHRDNLMTAHSIRPSPGPSNRPPNPQFLPWHREYLFQVECRLRQFNPSVTIPYWDWSVDADAPGSSSIWKLIGGALPGKSIPNEPFKDWSSSVPKPHKVVRGFNSTAPRSGWNWGLEDEETIQNFQRNGTRPYHNFSSTLEILHGGAHLGIGGAHLGIGGAHLGIGGDMSLLSSSPNDPVFFLHHAFIDKIWGEWQKLPGKRREYNGRFGSRNVRLSDRLSPWKGTVGDMFARDECVTYEERTISRATPQSESDGNVGEDEDSEPLPTNIPKKLAEKAKKSPTVRSALKDANEREIEKLSNAKPGRLEAIAKRIFKDQRMEKWGREIGAPQEMIELARKVAAEEDPSVEYNEVEDGTPP